MPNPRRPCSSRVDSGGRALNVAAAAPALSQCAHSALTSSCSTSAAAAPPCRSCDCEEHDPVALAMLTGQTSPADALTAECRGVCGLRGPFRGGGHRPGGLRDARERRGCAGRGDGTRVCRLRLRGRLGDGTRTARRCREMPQPACGASSWTPSMPASVKRWSAPCHHPPRAAIQAVVQRLRGG